MEWIPGMSFKGKFRDNLQSIGSLQTSPNPTSVLNLPCTVSVRLKMCSRRRLTDILRVHQRTLALLRRVEFPSGICTLLINLSSQGNCLHECWMSSEDLKCNMFLIYCSGGLKLKCGLGRTSFQFAMSKLKSTFFRHSEVVAVHMYILFSKPKSTLL